MIKITTGARLRMKNGTGGQREEKDFRNQRKSIYTLNPPACESLNLI
jgi:hypothetical protein